MFRPEAVQHATRRLGGEVVIISPLSIWIFGSLLCLVLALATTFAATAQYARKEVVVGWLVPETGAVRALALRGGVVLEVLVQPGDEVAADQPIARVDLSVAIASGDLASALKKALQRLESAASAQLMATQQRLNAERQRLTARRSNALLERETLDAQIRDVEVRLENAEATAVWARENFEEGLTTRAEAETWENAARDIRQTALRLRQSQAQLQTQLEDIDQRIAAIAPELEAAEAAYQTTQAELSERLARAEAESEYLVTSPIAGRVEAVSVDLGQTIAVGGTIAVLSPAGSELVAELFVPSRAAGFIAPGQSVRLKYDAFPFQRFGAADGEVISVSRTVLSPSEIPFPGTLTQEPVFRVKARLSNVEIEAYGAEIPLRTGMLLNADIVFDQRTLLEWLLDPVYAVGRR